MITLGSGAYGFDRQCLASTLDIWHSPLFENYTCAANKQGTVCVIVGERSNTSRSSTRIVPNLAVA
jgi:hypothetical protein